MAFNLQEEEDFVFVEVNLQPNVCDIINTEMEREVIYWKSIALKENDDSSLIDNAPKSRKLRTKAKKSNASKSQDVNKVLAELQSKYCNEIPNVNYLSPVSSETMSLQDLRQQLENCFAMTRKTDNFVLKNAYTFGNWLIYAEKIFKEEKYLKRNSALPKQFGMWVKTFGISRKTSDIYKKVYKLISKAPKLINCQISITFLMKNYLLLKEHFKREDGEYPWKHDLNCLCEKCGAYFC